MKMKGRIKLKSTLAGLCILAASGAVHAQDAALNLSLPSEPKAAHSFMLASNDTASANLPASVTHSTPSAEFQAPLFSGDKLHQYLGLTTLVLAGLTAVTAPGDGGCEGVCPQPTTPQPRQTNGTHAKLAKAAGAMALATVVSGLIDHWDDFHFEDGFTDPDNMHAMLGTAGSLAMMYAINKSANSKTPVSHAGIAELGAVAMVVAVKLTW
jgi:hypothetical protein